MGGSEKQGGMQGRVWGAGPTWRYFLTFPWATMTSDGARREAVRRRSAEGREEDAEVQGSVEEAHDGDAIALALPFASGAVCPFASAARTTLSYPSTSRLA